MTDPATTRWVYTENQGLSGSQLTRPSCLPLNPGESGFFGYGIARTIRVHDHPPTNRRHMLAKIQIQALDKARIDRPTALGQDRRDGLCRAEYNAVGDAHEAPAAVGLDHLCVEQLRQWQPARFGPGSSGLAALGLNPMAVVGHERGEIRPEPIGET